VLDQEERQQERDALNKVVIAVYQGIRDLPDESAWVDPFCTIAQQLENSIERYDPSYRRGKATKIRKQRALASAPVELFLISGEARTPDGTADRT
jgi:hypothetical protein